MADQATTKRKRHSKNKKKYWKKHADVNDVDEFLEDQRLQERTGGLVSEKADDQLFFVDTAVDTTGDQEVPRKKKKWASKPLKCHSALLPDPRIKPGYVMQDVRKEKPKKKDLLPAKVTKADLRKQDQRVEAGQRRSKRINTKFVPPADYDLWGKAEEKDSKANNHYFRIMKKLPMKPPPTYNKKPSAIAAVEVIHPGASYNPTFEDHQDLMKQAVDTELKKEKDEKRLKKALDDMFPDASVAPTEDDRRNELAEGLFDESDEEEEDEEEERLSLNPPVRRDDKKTEKQRSKEKKVKDEQKRAQLQKEDRINKNKVFQLKSTKRKVKEMLVKQEDRRTRKAARVAANKDKTKRLGKNKFEEADLEVKTSDEIEGSLRLLKPEGHLLADRFKSFQKRNIIEPRGRASVKLKYKRKKFEKKSHKNVV